MQCLPISTGCGLAQSKWEIPNATPNTADGSRSGPLKSPEIKVALSSSATHWR
jgi:hypothetical protein